jgi:cyclopropane fatty-acyl-phospholipid synthase-like methyltransferase
LTNSGRGLLHFIGRDQPSPLNAWIRRRIFPGAYPPALREVFERVLEPPGFSVLDVENLRLHYAKTLDARSRLAALPRGIARRLHDRLAAALPGGIHPLGQQPDPLDTRRSLKTKRDLRR